MKTTLILFTLMFFVSCASNQNKPITDDERAQKELVYRADFR